jgi:hypothetical protein
MTDNPTSTPGTSEPLNPQVRFERSDADANGVYIFAAGLVALIMLSSVGMLFLMWGLAAQQKEEKKPQDYWTTHAPEKVGSFPRKQEQPTEKDSKLDRDPHSRLVPLPYLEKVELESMDQDAGRVRELTIQQQILEEEGRLASYGWQPGSGQGEQRIVYVPIEEAMKRLAKKLPVRKGGKPDDATLEFYRAPSRSSSGQMPRGGGS